MALFGVCGPSTPASTTHTANTSATAAATARVTRASTRAVITSGSGRPGLSGSNRGFRHANATKANVNVSAHAAPTTA